ncbi:hypothetical protein NMG60_11020505 [Bertholletia excelsa]
MPRKKSPIYQKVSNYLLRAPIFIAKMKRPIIPKLIFLKKSSRVKKFKLLEHDISYGYFQEYQFSPSSTPLIHNYRKPLNKRKYADFYSVLFMCKCLGRLGDGGGHVEYPLEVFPAAEVAVSRELSALSDCGSEDDSVDERAERFIERFYEEMRMQRRESLLQLMDG